MILGMIRFFRSKRKRCAQSFFEYSLGMSAVVLLMFGMTKVFLWVGRDQVQRIQAHDRILRENIISGCGGTSGCVLRQIRPTFYIPDGFDAAVDGDIYGNIQARFPPYTH